MKLGAPFPYFGGKAPIAPLVWNALGNVKRYCEPFAGSAIVLLRRPESHRRPDGSWPSELINDLDALLQNFWRAVHLTRETAQQTAWAADWPIHESDLHARHRWLVGQRESITAQLEADPFWCDPLAAGWWAWGLSQWIGGSWCTTRGNTWRERPMQQRGGGANGLLTRRMTHPDPETAALDRYCKAVRMDLAPASVARHVHLARSGGVDSQKLGRRIPYLYTGSRGVVQNALVRPQGEDDQPYLYDYFLALHERLRHVSVTTGDWSRITGHSPTTYCGLTGMFLDPPYGDTRDPDLYATDSTTVMHDVAEYCRARGNDPQLRIVLCGYDGELEMPAGWIKVRWMAAGGYAGLGQGRGTENRRRELVWLSPHCAAHSNQMELVFE